MKLDGRRLSVSAIPGATGRFFFNRLILLVALSAILVIALGVFASRSLATLNEGTEWVVHAQVVQTKLARVLQLLVDMGGGLRRFEMTHDEHSFQEGETAAADFPEEFKALHEVLAGEPALQASEKELIDAAQERVRQTRRLMDMARSGDLAGIRASIQRGDSLAALDRCRSIIAQMQEEETQIFDRHRRASVAARDSVAFAIVATTALAVILLILVAYVSVRHSGRLQRVERALREADQRKDVFLATLSHELRNPLAPIRNAAKLLESSTLTGDELQRCRLIISRQVHHMASLLDDLLDVSRITRGVLTLKKEIVPLRGLLEAAVETARPAIDAKSHRLVVDWPPPDSRIEADPVRFTQIVTNLLTNAAKYTDPEGRIDLGWRGDGRSLTVYVRDTGIGLAPDMLQKIFEMFSQVAPDKGHSEGGLGIGLALVKGLVELHGGNVEAYSAGLEKGSEFRVSLPNALLDPAPQADTTAAPPDADARTGSLRILIADDNRDSAESLAMLLELSGHSVQVAHDGVAALALAGKQHPDVALLDIGMPGMDGYEVAAAIRREPWGAAITLIAVTGWGQDNDKQMAHDVGFDHHLTKPMDSAVLASILAGIPARTGPARDLR